MAKIEKLQGVEYIDISTITVGERLRENTPEVKAYIERLADSIRQFGPIAPLVLDDENNLVAGGCRIQAYALLEETQVPIVRRNKLNEAKLKILEVEENLTRHEMTWQEKVLGIYTVHMDGKNRKLSIKSAAGIKQATWTVRTTGHLIGVSHAHVADALRIAEYLIADDPEVKSQPNFSRAKEVILLRLERRVQSALAWRTSNIRTVDLESMQKPQIAAAPSEATIKVIDINKPVDLTSLLDPAPSKDLTKAPPLNIVNLRNRLINGDCIEVMSNMEPESFDICVTDIPYGIDMANLEGMQGIEQMEATHQVDQNVSLMKPFLNGVYRILKPNTYLLFFYALQHNEKLRDWGTEAGFKVLDWPILWLKPHSSRNNAPHANPTKSYEPVMVMRKGKGSMAKPMAKSHFECSHLDDKKLQSNPFAKPGEFLDWMLPHFVHPGMSIIDPFAGGGSILRSAIRQGLVPTGIELDTERYPELVNSVKTTYKNILGSGTKFEL